MYLDDEARSTLGAYLAGKRSLDALLEWVTSAADDAALSEDESPGLATLLLLMDEVTEGLRTIDEVNRAVVRILAPEPIGMRTGAAPLIKKSNQ